MPTLIASFFRLLFLLFKIVILVYGHGNEEFCPKNDQQVLFSCYRAYFTALEVKNSTNAFPGIENFDSKQRELLRENLAYFCYQQIRLINCTAAIARTCFTRFTLSSIGNLSDADALVYLLHRRTHFFSCTSKMNKTDAECVNIDVPFIQECLENIIASNCQTLIEAIDYCVVHVDGCNRGSAKPVKCGLAMAYYETMHDNFHWIASRCRYNCRVDQNYTGVPPRMIKYTQRLAKLINHWNFLRRFIFGWLAFILALLALVVGLLFVVTTIRAMVNHRVSRKCYALLLNRSVGDVVACLIIIIAHRFWMGYMQAIDEGHSEAVYANLEMIKIFELFFFINFWTALTSYGSLSLLKLYAVAEPLQFRRNVTLSRCYQLIFITWLIFFALPVSQFFGCNQICADLRLAAIFIGYVLPLMCFVISVIFIRRSQRYAASFGAKTSTETVRKLSRFPLWKLALNVLVFTVFSAPYVVCFVYYHIKPSNYFDENRKLAFEVLSGMRIALLLRILIDGILAFVVDFEIRRGFWQWTRLDRIVSIHSPVNSSNSIGQKQSQSRSRNSTKLSGASNRTGNSIKMQQTSPPQSPTCK